LLNEYFTSIGEELAAGLDNVSDSTAHTTRKKVEKIIDPLDANKASGYDRVSVRAIRARKHELIPYVVHYINCNMNSGIYPDCLKLAKGRPLHKSGNSVMCGQLRTNIGAFSCQKMLKRK
jgi:hypothetical protein